MEKVINTILFGKGKDSLRNKYCLYKTQENNPDWTLKVWTEEDDDIKLILKNNSFLSLENKYPSTSITYEFIKLNLMLKYGGLWMEADTECTKLPEFNSEISYLQEWKRESYSLVTFNTWAPVYINNKDEYINQSLIRCINSLKESKDYFYNENTVSGAECIYQVVSSIIPEVISQFLEKEPQNDISILFKKLGFNFTLNTIFAKTCFHWNMWRLTTLKDSDSLLYCAYKDTLDEKFNIFDINKVDKVLLNETIKTM